MGGSRTAVLTAGHESAGSLRCSIDLDPAAHTPGSHTWGLCCPLRPAHLGGVRGPCPCRAFLSLPPAPPAVHPISPHTLTWVGSVAPASAMRSRYSSASHLLASLSRACTQGGRGEGGGGRDKSIRSKSLEQIRSLRASTHTSPCLECPLQQPRRPPTHLTLSASSAFT